MRRQLIEKARNPHTMATGLALLAALTLAAGCATTAVGEPATAPTPTAVDPPLSDPADAVPGDPRFPWMKPPAPIAGKWRVEGCPQKVGMIVVFELTEPEAAIGHVVTPGGAEKYGYYPGEKIFELAANKFGNWRGRLKWRSVTVSERWDPIYFTMDGGLLTATMTTDPCYAALTPIPR